MGGIWRWGCRHAEALSVIAVGVLLTISMNWPLVTQLDKTIPGNLFDPLHQTWSMAWPSHAVFDDSVPLWRGNIFAGEEYAYAYADPLLGLAPLGVFGSGIAGALVQYNIVFLLSGALTFIGGYALLRQLGAHWSGALLAGVVLAYAPWRLAHSDHLNILFAGVVFLALFALARGHGVTLDKDPERSRKRPAWALVGWLLACWQLSIGFTMGVAIAYLLAGVVCLGILVWWMRGRPRQPRRLLAADALGIAAYLLTAGFMAQPYLHMMERYPFATDDRGVWLDLLSPPVRGLFTAPHESWLWGERHAGMREGVFWSPETSLLIGVGVLALGILGVFYSAWSRTLRLLLVTGVLLTAVFALGTTFFEGRYTTGLLTQLPGWSALRTPGRFIFWTTLLVAILAAGALTRAAVALPTRVRRPAALRLAMIALLIPAVLAVAEGVAVRGYPTPPTPPKSVVHALRNAESRVAILGVDDHTAMFWSIEGFPPLLNGYASFNPPSRGVRIDALESFPDASSVQYLRRHRASTVIVARTDEGEKILQRPSEGLGLSRRIYPQAAVYTVQP